MKASRFAEILGGICFLAGALISSLFSHWAGIVVALVGIGWWIIWGQNLRGWIGPSFKALHEQKAELEALLESRKQQFIPADQHTELTDEIHRVQAMIAANPECSDIKAQLNELEKQKEILDLKAWQSIPIEVRKSILDQIRRIEKQIADHPENPTSPSWS